MNCVTFPFMGVMVSFLAVGCAAAITCLCAGMLRSREFQKLRNMKEGLKLLIQLYYEGHEERKDSTDRQETAKETA